MKIKLSYATAAILGLKKGKINFEMPTAYLMLGEKCQYNCSFCAQAKDAKSDVDYLSRIKWPEYDVEIFLNKLEELNPFKRLCIQVVNSIGYFEELKSFLEKIKDFNVLKAVSLRPKDFDEIDEIFSYGIDNLGISIDVANKDLYSEIRGGSFDFLFGMLTDASKKYPNKITTHIIVGLGESDKDLVELMLEMKKINVLVSLFSFTPIKGTKLENLEPPSIERYRIIQYAREIIEKNDVSIEDFVFDENQKLVRLPHIDFDVEEAIKTSGCSYCTRPYYNEKPNKVLYNIPESRKF
ncbi:MULTISPECIES: radical SAM protein [unclassified Marinitoga]|uniref:radical SAM protein n=1 Tax=unclassified Marinitoga TaxID=2640159 RepID=UPI00095060CD|nr:MULTISPECIES: radical SAM protein [unclassified Marinitoga]APT75460.1 radical SAM protein [Marinitoga sp. 1137]NUU97117.1 radical SAM protein [Marinitoga sp. 1138]